MKIKVLSIILVAVIVLALVGLSQKPTESAPIHSGAEILQMVRDIQTLNLLNSLHLSKNQMQKMLPIAKEVDRMDRDQKAMFQRKNNEIYKILNEMRSRLITSNDLPQDLKRKFQNAQEEIKRKQVANRDRLKVLNGKMKSILNENQLVMLKEYQPCLVPVKNISNPERIGQAGGNERHVKLLEIARRIPDAHYPEFKRRVTEKIQSKIKLHIPEDSERKRLLNQISRAMDKARTLDDEEFEIQKYELVKNIAPKSAGERLKDRNINVENHFIEKFLLNPNLASILKRKMRTAGR